MGSLAQEADYIIVRIMIDALVRFMEVHESGIYYIFPAYFADDRRSGSETLAFPNIRLRSKSLLFARSYIHSRWIRHGECSSIITLCIPV